MVHTVRLRMSIREVLGDDENGVQRKDMRQPAVSIDER